MLQSEFFVWATTSAFYFSVIATDIHAGVAISYITGDSHTGVTTGSKRQEIGSNVVDKLFNQRMY